MDPTEIPTPIADAGMALADIAIAIALILIGGALAAGVYLLSFRLEKHLEGREETGAHIVENAIVALRHPLPIGIVATALYIALRYVLDLDRTSPWIGDPRLPEVLSIILVSWGVANLLSRLVRSYGRRFIFGSEREDGASLVDIASVGVRYLVWFVAILYLLNFLDISITPLIAGAGIAGIAVALATQDVLSNLFGGVIILLDKPLRVGDRVRIDPYTGTVLRIGLRSTRIMTLDGLLATVPNSRITSNIVVNYSAGTGYTTVQVPVTVDYHTPIDESLAVLEEMAKATIASAPPEWGLRDHSVRIGELGEFGPVLVLSFSALDETDPLAVRNAVYAHVAKAIWSGRLATGFDRSAREDGSPVAAAFPNTVERRDGRT